MSSALEQIQRRMAAAVMQPLTLSEQMKQRNPAGRSNATEAADFIKPNDRLTSFERLEIYNRQYWFRLFSSFQEDFPGVEAIVGRKRFQSLMRAYLEACPSTSFSLRNLGSRLVAWLDENPSYTGPHIEAAREMAALEWAHIEAFDGLALPRLAPEMLLGVGEDSQIALQPYLGFVRAHYAVDDALLAVRSETGSSNGSSNNASTGYIARKLRTIRSLPREDVFLAVHRHDDSVYYKRLSREDFQILSALRDGKTLGEAIESGFDGSDTPEDQRPAYLQSAFAHWMELGWFCIPPEERDRA
ncbi:hypothetical protein GCM10011507_19230 [Edaphobacter acidisoli]|uniref:Putative DNA-binding domain-containing protein n=1 Tax=Edaphobacter acidisoli TaxID=2040573 RepID=A0A916RSW9_9BACT|nr:DNA-binding domain-containing protein [Edaphobacter acidisoli]GGA67913.1 hypothetical protein GCM10011507_19230 [Edaphobacter acidisoli]